MLTRFVAEPCRQTVETELQGLLAHPDVQAVMLLVSIGKDCHACDHFDRVLQEADKPVFGGIFPGILWNGRQYDQGAVLLGLTCPVQVAVLEDLNASSHDLTNSLQLQFDDDAGSRQTLFTFIDGVSSHIGTLISALFNQFGLEINYIGGGCGSLSFCDGPCVITPKGILSQAAVLVLADCHSGVGVAHGWEPVSGAYKVTESNGNRIISLDWLPAMQVYRGIVEEHAGEALGDENFLSLVKAYPFGIAKLTHEMVVRDPVRCEGNTLVCVGEVRRGAYVHIMHGQPDSLIRAARLARDKARQSFGEAVPEAMVFVNCISRSLFLGADFADEISCVADPAIPMVGALTLGEIANNGQEFLELFNKTSVVGLL